MTRVFAQAISLSRHYLISGQILFGSLDFDFVRTPPGELRLWSHKPFLAVVCKLIKYNTHYCIQKDIQ